MPSYTIEIPGKGSYTVDSPTDLTDYQAYRAVQKQIAADEIALQQHQAKTGFVPAVKAGAREFLAGAEEALGFDKAAEEQRQKAAATYEGMTEEDIARAKEQGILPTIGAYKTKYLTEPLGGIVGRFGAPVAAGAAGAALAPEAAAGLVGAGVTALTDVPAEIGENIARQKEQGKEVDRTAATIAGLAQAGIAGFGVPGMGPLNKILGPKILAEAEALAPRVRAGVITQDAAVTQLSGRAKSYAQAMAANTVGGTALMAGTEELRRLQAGQEGMTGQEFAETAGQAALLSPFFALLHPTRRAEAQKAIREAGIIRQEQIDLIANKIHSAPNKSIQDIINDVVGIKPEIAKEELKVAYKEKQADLEAALNEPSGQYVIDPATQQQKELTVGELQKVQRPELFPEDLVTDKTLTDLGIKASTPLVKKGGLRDLDLNKPEEAKQFIDGLTLFKDQKEVDSETKLRIEAKIKEVENNLKTLETRQKEAQDERLKSTTDRENIQVSREPLGGRAEGIAEPVRDRVIEPTADLRPTEMGEARRSTPLAPETTEVIKGENEITQKIKDMVGKSLKEGKMEEKGQSILNELDDANIGPKDVAKKFWAETYFNLPAEVQRKFTKYLKSLSGFEPGGYWRDWLHIADEYTLDMPNKIEHLEGTERGYVSLMEEANRRYAEAKSTIVPKELPKYARDEIALTRETPETIISALKERFGNNVQRAINRGEIKLIKSDEVPANIPNDVPAYFDKGVAHLIVDRLTKEEAPRKILHETGAHYALEGMLGKNLYRDTLRTINRLSTTDPTVKAALEHVNNRYKELTPGSREHLEEVLARVGESAPNHTVWRRIVAAVKDFLIRKGLWNPNKMDVRDIHDLINRSTARALAGKIRPEMKEGVKYAKGELPISDKFKDTKVYSPPGEDQERSFKEFATGNYEQFKTEEGRKNIKDSVSRAFLEGRMKVAYAGAGIQSKLIKDFNGAVTDALGDVRADILYDQALNGNILGSVSAKEGPVIFDQNGVAKVKPSPYHISAVFDEQAKLAKTLNPADAKHVANAYLQAVRNKEVLENNAKYEALLKRTDNEKLKEQYRREIKYISDEQRAAIEPALKYANEYPEVKKMGDIYDKVRLDEIDMLEEAGIYTKDYAQKLRNTKGYVPLFRVMDDLENMSPGAKQYFRGLVDIGKQHAFEGSDRQTLDVLDNMLTRHMWAVNAAVRNNANKRLAKTIAVSDEKGNPIYHYQISADKADRMAPVWENGVRKYVEYTDPMFAQSVYGLEPSLGPILGIMGKASNALRIGVTATPTFQVYQLFNDAPRAALLSGVDKPFKLMSEVFKSFYTTLKDPNDPIIREMHRLGISGGFGHTARDIADKMRRDLGIEANTLGKRAKDKAEQFAAASDMAQRRAIFKRTLLETGGVENADGSITGGNKVLAMDRAMNIIHWQKRGTSNKVRVLTQVVPFLNAYIQGMDTLIRAMRGEGISGMEKKQAQLLFAQTAIKIAALSTIYAMVVGGDEEYQKLDDRQKIRSFIIPGTGIKVPVASEVAMLTKAIPEMTWQYINREGTANPMDSTKLMQAISGSFADGLLGPNLMPQAFRAGVEVATNHDFLTGHPVVGRGLENLATSEQFTENTSELSKLIGKTGIISPVNLDHLIKGYGGTMAAGVLYATDATANMFYNDKLPTTPLYRVPMIGSFMYSPEGKGQLNDYYDLKNRSDEVTSTLNHIRKFGTPEEAQEYATDNKEILAIRGQVNAISNQMKTLREQRKRIIASNLSSDEKRSQINTIDARINNMVQNIGALRVKAGL